MTLCLCCVFHFLAFSCHLTLFASNFHFHNTIVLQRCVRALKDQGFPESMIECEAFLHLRYDRTDCALMCAASDGSDEALSPTAGDFLRTFLSRYKTEFGFTLPDRAVMVDDVRVRGVGRTEFGNEPDIEIRDEGSDGPEEVETRPVYFSGGFQPTKVFLLKDLLAGDELPGPAIIMDDLSTILVDPDCRASITKQGNIRINIGDTDKRSDVLGTALDAVQLSIFSHRFMSIAEQMGRILQRTSISTNIKERLDFSCALFGPDGGLVSNAPHIPVHLGAMQETVRHQMNFLGKLYCTSYANNCLGSVQIPDSSAICCLLAHYFDLLRSRSSILLYPISGDNLHPGDVILANHPKAGGSHLPDLTVITPVFYPGQEKPVFFVANRGHHADIGGITPGSMPPHSTYLWQEGASFKSFKLVDAGVFQEEALVNSLFHEPAAFPGSSGSRCLQDNLSDLKAQIAANQKGITLVSALIDAYGLAVVQAYMGHIQKNAELAVRAMLKEIGQRAKESRGKSELLAVDFMDGGSPIKLRVDIDADKGEAVFDFTGSGAQVWGNTNAPRAVVFSALIYSLRCMIGHDIPLNQGCLTPVRVIIPPGSLLDPSEECAVVGGNVLTSQRIVDVVFKAFEAMAASQGCCNNVTFGDELFGYYETVAGGSGAGPGWHGRSGVHVHMTNTRLTDPEILERRYPVVLKHFSLAPGTGGRGAFAGGDGVLREILFRKDLSLSVLSERRVLRPYGLRGGEAGKKGLNLLHRSDGRTLYLGGKCSISVKAGDVFSMRTPGGGGWGSEEEEEGARERAAEDKWQKFVPKGSLHQYEQTQFSA